MNAVLSIVKLDLQKLPDFVRQYTLDGYKILGHNVVIVDEDLYLYGGAFSALHEETPLVIFDKELYDSLSRDAFLGIVGHEVGHLMTMKRVDLSNVDVRDEKAMEEALKKDTELEMEMDAIGASMVGGFRVAEGLAGVIQYMEKKKIVSEKRVFDIFMGIIKKRIDRLTH